MNASESQIALAVTRLKNAGLVAFPTETVYGLGADATNPQAIARVFEIKKRPPTNPLIVHVTGPDMAAPLVDNWPREADLLASAFWPGPLTLVLPRSNSVPDIITAGGSTVALRAPNHPVARALLQAFAGPLVGPSANPSGTVSPTRPEHVRTAFSEDDVLVLDGGPCEAGIESTVIKITQDALTILRRGPISAAQIEATLSRPVLIQTHAPEGAAESPGMLSRHYAPAAPVALLQAGEVETALSAPCPICLISHHHRATTSPHTLIPMPTTASAYAAALYTALREADTHTPDLIAIELPTPPQDASPDERSLWEAIHDRLKRAASTG